jgi:hypothetical protein
VWWTGMSALIDIDLMPEVAVELPAKVEAEGEVYRLTPWSLPRWVSVLKRFSGKTVRLYILAENKRSAEANRLLWGYVYRPLLRDLRARASEAGEECPFRTLEELHDAFKYLILGTEVKSFLGQTITLPATTTKLNKAQFSAYMDRVVEIARDRWEIYIPPPGMEAA